MKPRAAFVIPAYNAAGTLEETVRSALSQTEPDIEVAVVDDGSTDGTGEVADRLAAEHSRVAAVHQENAGVGTARNRGIAETTAPYLVFLDADDLVAPTKVEAQAAILDADPDLAMVFSSADEYVEEGGRWVARFHADPPTPYGEAMLRGEPKVCCCHSALHRREVVTRMGGFREERELQGVCDILLYVRMALAGCRFRHEPEPKVLYRRHPGTVSGNHLHMLRGRHRVLEYLYRELPDEPAERKDFVRKRARYLTAVVAGTMDEAGEPGARRMLLRTLRYGRRPGEILEVLRCLPRPSRILP